MLGRTRDVRELITCLEGVASIGVPNDEFCTMRDCECKLAFSDNDVEGTTSAVEVMFDNIEDRTDAEAVLLDTDAMDKYNEVTLTVMLSWVDVSIV